LRFEEFKRRVRRFNRVGLVTIGTRILWYAWNHPELLDPAVPGGIGNLITQVYAERLIALACITAPDDQGRSLPSEVDFRLLCWELHHYCSDGPWLGPAGADALDQAIGVLPLNHPIRELSREELRGLSAIAFKARYTYAYAGRRWDGGDLLRPWLVAKELGILARQAAGDRYDDFQKRFFLTSLDGFVRSSWALFTKADQGTTFFLPNGAQVHEYGRFRTSDWPEREPDFERLDMTAEDTRVVAHRLATSLSEYVEKRPLLNQMPAEGWKHHELLDWLSIRPIIDIDDNEPREDLLVPSPWRFLTGMGAVLEHEFIQALQQNRDIALGGQDAFSMRGTAFGAYLRRTLAGVTEVTDLDAVAGIRGVRPDFLWLAERHGILIEAKALLKPNDDRRLLKISSVVETWRRCTEALTQASGFLQRELGVLRLPKLPQHWSLILVANEPLVEDATGFKAVACVRKLLDRTGIDALALLTTSELEAWALGGGTADQLGDKVLSLWSRFDPADVTQDFNVGRPENAPTILPHIEKGWNTLLYGGT
jgi:hypothetical protein